jgi:hypothetical protein
MKIVLTNCGLQLPFTAKDSVWRVSPVRAFIICGALALWLKTTSLADHGHRSNHKARAPAPGCAIFPLKIEDLPSSSISPFFGRELAFLFVRSISVKLKFTVKWQAILELGKAV